MATKSPLSIQSKPVDRNVWQSSRFRDKAPLRSQIVMVLRLAQSRFEVLVLGAHLIGENLGLIYRWGSPKKNPGRFRGCERCFQTIPKSLRMLYILTCQMKLDIALCVGSGGPPPSHRCCLTTPFSMTTRTIFFILDFLKRA